MKRTGKTGEIAAIGYFEAGQKGNPLAEESAPKEKKGERNRTAQNRPERTSPRGLRHPDVRKLGRTSVHSFKEWCFFLNIPDEIPSGAAGLRTNATAFRDPSDLLDSPGFSPSLGF
jgi:hypothetical protein